MLEALQGFARELRARGSRVSQAEMIDAARAAAAVGPEDRDRFRVALTVTLAKGARDRAIFDEAFEAFFAPPRRSGHERGRGGGAGDPGAGGSGSGTGGGGSAKPGERPPGGEPSAGRPSARAHTPALGQPAVSSGRPAINETAAAGARSPRGEGLSQPRRARPRPLRAEEIRRQLDLDRSGAPDRTREGKSARAVPGSGARAPEHDESAQRMRLARLLASGSERETTSDIRRQDLRGSVPTDEERRMAREAARLVDEIRLVRARRLRRAPRGRLFMKRAIRENLATGGVPFRIPHQMPRRKRPRIVLVVDVSFSVARAAGLFLMMALEFLRPPRRASVWLFVDRPVEATGALRRWLRRAPSVLRGAPHDPAGDGGGAGSGHGARIAEGARHDAGTAASRGAVAAGPGWSPYGTAATRAARRGHAARAPGRASAAGGGIAPLGGSGSFLDLLQSISGLDLTAPSDYGRAFYALASGPLRSIGRDSIVVVLGDGRTNVFEPLPWAFEEIASRARRVLWLVSEPRSRWGTGDSALLRYLPFCDVAVEAADLEGLAHGVQELLRSL